jgi:NADP-dependent 3-hydroxy acid dehydrogenase YdfG
VAVVGRSGDDAVAVAKSVGGAAMQADLTDLKALAGLVEIVVEWAKGAPDILVNNAGAFPHAEIAKQSPDELGRALTLNVEAPFALIRAFLPAMRSRGSGDVVTVGSIADKTAFTGNAAYSASKYGIRAVHEVLRTETRGTGIRAILVSPGAVDTGIWDPHEASIGSRFPKRADMLVADDVARAIVFAVSQPAHVDVDELRLTRS